jgi:hypothetical protein
MRHQDYNTQLLTSFLPIILTVVFATVASNINSPRYKFFLNILILMGFVLPKSSEI